MGVSNSKKNSKTCTKDLISQNDLDLVKKTWTNIDSHDALGISIMIRIFQEHKEIKGIWIFAANLETEEEMRKNSQLKYHAKKVIDVLGGLLNKLETVNDLKSEEIRTNLIRLGESHFHYNVTREHFPIFEESLLFCMKKQLKDKSLLNSKAEKAWKKLFQDVANKMCEGINSEKIAENQ